MLDERASCSQVYEARLSPAGCCDAFLADEGDEVKLGRSDLTSDGIPPERLRKTDQVWLLLITHSKGVDLDIVSEAKRGANWLRTTVLATSRREEDSP